MLRAEPFALDGAPYMEAVAVTRRFLVVFDLPYVYSRTADLIGVRLPYTWREDRAARVGLLPLPVRVSGRRRAHQTRPRGRLVTHGPSDAPLLPLMIHIVMAGGNLSGKEVIKELLRYAGDRSFWGTSLNRVPP